MDERYGIGEGLTNEMLSRCEIHSLLVGIYIAIPSGAAVAISILGEKTGSLIGVAISASLLPPAVNSVGISILLAFQGNLRLFLSFLQIICLFYRVFYGHLR